MRNRFLPALCALALQVAVTTPSAQAAFIDVAPSHPLYPAVTYVESKGIVSGYADGSFQPGNSISRSEFTKILVRAKYTAATIDSCMTNIVVLFSDTPRDAWFTPFVCTAFREGIVNGYPDASFRPQNKITMAEAAKVIVNTFHLPPPPKRAPEMAEYDLYVLSKGNLDEGRNPYWWQPSIATLRNLHALPASYTGPLQVVERGEMVEMIYRVMQPSSSSAPGSTDSSSSVSSSPSSSSSSASTVSSASSLRPSIRRSSSSVSSWTQSSQAQSQWSSAAPASSSASVPRGPTDLSLSLRAPAGLSDLGPTIGYSVTVKNLGPLSTIAPISVRFVKPEHATFIVSVLDKSCRVQANGDAVCVGNTLAPGEDDFLVANFTADPGCWGPVTMTAKLNGAEQQDTNSANDTASSVTKTSDCKRPVANLYVTKDDAPAPSHQLLGGARGESVLNLRFTAENTAVQMNRLQLTVESANASTPANDAGRSIKLIELYRPGDTKPYAYAGGCQYQMGSARLKAFCVNDPARLTIQPGQALVLQARPIMRSQQEDTGAAVGGDAFRLTLEANPAADAVDSAEIPGSTALARNDGDPQREGEGTVFIGRSTPGPNVKISGEQQVVVLSKIRAVEVPQPPDDTGPLPQGEGPIAAFKFSPAEHTNVLNGMNAVRVTDLIFTVKAQNVTLDGSAFKLFSYADWEKKMPCRAFQSYGAPITQNATGVFHVTCASIPQSGVNTRSTPEAPLVLMLQGTTLNADSILHGSLQVSLSSISNPSLPLIKNENGTINSGGSHIAWEDANMATTRSYSWIDIPEQEVRSTLYSK